MHHHLLLWLIFPAVLGFADPEYSLYSTLKPSSGLQEQDWTQPADDAATEGEYDDEEDYSYDYKAEFNDSNTNIFQVKLFNKTYNGTFIKSINYFKIDDEDISSRLNLSDGMQSLQKLFCMVYNNSQFSCNWTAQKPPSDTHISFTVFQQNARARTWNCSTRRSSEVVECSGRINPDKHLMTVQITFSLPNSLYVHTQHFEVKEIEKLNPPHRITMSLTAGDLRIEWDRPQNIGENCFNYQLRLSNDTEPISLIGQRTHTLPSVDPARKYSVQIRVKKTNTCMENYIWSDWSEVVVLNAVQQPSSINVLQIVGIGLGIPMILLALLLFCRFHRIYDKIFPQIPGPSKKMKILLEKEHLFLTTKTKCTEETLQDVTIVECVKLPD
ncbi:interleukin-13 receptor subunit alpha-1-like [Scleropages formosus]|uniref:interleukin-13 receptor subunit alpha-1-like n=1 Tax=Scleropages formosus TaxID=113540 RepID=UPI000878D887|nr:interleukin-13 receptor subunit alpha-1-like [Scleropages formosus]